MPPDIGVGILGQSIEPLQRAGLDGKSEPEDAFVAGVAVLGPERHFVGRQPSASRGAVIEIERSRAPRDAVAQVLCDGSWMTDLGIEHFQVADDA